MIGKKKKRNKKSLVIIIPSKDRIYINNEYNTFIYFMISLYITSIPFWAGICFVLAMIIWNPYFLIVSLSLLFVSIFFNISHFMEDKK